MDITAETMQKVLDIAHPEIHDLVDAHGREARYSTKELFEVEAEAPKTPAPIAVTTLAGFADLVRAKLESRDFPADYLVHIQDHNIVVLKARVSDEYGRRLELIKATPVQFRQFQFGQWMAQEQFAIAIASMFADSTDKDYVIKTAASLTNEAARQSEDDGFSQKVTVKAGLAHKTEMTIKPRVALAPFRIFPEVQQPVSEFVFRARCEKDREPELMLIEADGGRWKVEAIGLIAQAMEAFGLNIPIIA